MTAGSALVSYLVAQKTWLTLYGCKTTIMSYLFSATPMSDDVITCQLSKLKDRAMEVLAAWRAVHNSQFSVTLNDVTFQLTYKVCILV
mgnify:CR=1 FL=1